MKKAVVIFSLFLLAACSYSFAGGDPKYPVILIPEELKKDNYAVVREKVFEFRILARNKSSYYSREVVTILNEKGKNLAIEAVGYDKLSKIVSLSASLYDSRGQLIKKIKQSDIYDHSAFEGLYSDNRMKSLDLTYMEFPYTYELEYEVECKYLYSIPTFHLYTDDEVGIQKTSYTIVYPQGQTPKLKLMGAPEPKRVNVGAVEKMTWTFENVRPTRWEKYSPDSRGYVPTILAAPKEFEYEGYVGNTDSWQSYGKFISELNKGRDLLPENTIARIKSITEGLSDREKIKVLYEYMQNKTRYVSIQVGIGGLQPFEAKVVDELGYGDCKALSNYMVAMLGHVGIKGIYATIMAEEGAPDVITDFPGHQANHAIVAVPLSQDTVWLECTSQTNPFGYLGRFTGNRHALLITQEGGKLVKTPAYNGDKDLLLRKATVSLNLNGQATTQIETKYLNRRFDDSYVGMYATHSADDQKRWVEHTTRIPAFDVLSYSFKTQNEPETSATVKLALNLPNYASVSGKRLFLVPNLMNRVTSIPEKTENRKRDICVRIPYTDIDSVEFNISETLYPEFLPDPQVIKSRFGTYEASFKLSEGKVIYRRKLSVKAGQFPADSYQEFIDFYKAVNKADNVKIIFLSKT
jgi:hypothetical protein